MALLIAALLGAYQLVLLPLIIGHRQIESTIVHTQELLQRYRALAEGRTQLAEQVSAQKEALKATAGYLTGPSHALAAAALQDRAKSVIERAQGELRSTQILPAQALETGIPMRRTALRIKFAVDIEGLQKVLYGLETGDPYVFVEELDIQQRQLGNVPEPTLDVTIGIAGYTNDRWESLLSTVASEDTDFQN
jgi:general secretion pathway protein M